MIPLALWLREHPEYGQCEINLVAVTPSAFSRVLQGNLDLEELAAKGRSGTYALLRELSFFSPAADPQTRFSQRRLPVTDRGLAYRPGRQTQQLFDRVYWFGGRGGGPDDAFEEAGALVRLLSYDGSANDLAAETGGSPMQWVGAVTAIEYPKLRYQRRMISSVLQQAYRSLRETPTGFEGAAGDDTALLDYTDAQTTRPLGGWFYQNRHGALAPGGSATAIDSGAADELARRTSEHAGIGTSYQDIVPHGTQVQGHNYHSDPAEWNKYVGAISATLKQRAQERQNHLEQTIRELRREEERAFGNWLREDLLQRRLSGEKPASTGEVLGALQRLEGQSRALDQRFGQGNLLSSEKTLDQCEEELGRAHNRFQNPPPARAAPSAAERISAGVAGAVAFLGVLAIANLIPGFVVGGVESGWLGWVGALAAMFAAYHGVQWWLLRGKVESASEHERRRRAEGTLFEAYRERDRVRALQWMMQELRGGGGRTAFFRELREQVQAARAVVERLADVYEALEDTATAELSQYGVSPPHVVAEVGECIIADPDVAEKIAGDLQRRIRIDAAATTEPRLQNLTLRLTHADDGEEALFDPTAADATLLWQALKGEEQAGLVDAQRVESRWRESVWKLVNWRLGQNLPEDFSAALAHCETDEAAATRSLATKLQGLDLPRPPSVVLRTPDSLPARRRVYVGSGAIEGEYNKARQLPEVGATRSVLRMYENPIVVPALGQQIVFLDLWVASDTPRSTPGVIGSAAEAESARDTYYGADRVPEAATAAKTCFTVVPELLAATKIELEGFVEPLAPAVVARLLGCDLDMRGPTYAELFYLLRARHRISSRREGSGPEARSIISIAGDDGDTRDLVSWPVAGLSDELFGAGRETVVSFDAFCEFMRFDGTPLIAGGASDGYGYGAAELYTRRWAGDPTRVAALQRATVLQWYEGDVGADSRAMIQLLEEDLTRMDSGDDAVRLSWERAMRRLLAGEERRGIRATLLNPA